MHYYADFEALEFESAEAIAKGVFPYYLNADKNKNALCPLFLSCCNHRGNLIQSQNVFHNPISFITLLNKLISNNRRNKEIFIWFHNVQYDFRIIIHELFCNEFIHIVDSENLEYIGEYKTLEGNDKAFSIIGESLSKYIGANVYYRGYKFNIRDTMSIINTGQDKILKEFGFELKTPIKWNTITIHNVEDFMPLLRERCEYDVQSLAKAIEQFKDELKSRYSAIGNTAAGLSLDALKYFLSYTTKKQTGEEISKEESFATAYPTLSDREKDISKGCYHGGICTINKDFSGRNLFNIQMVDIHSSYPYAMTKELPHGYGTEISDFTDNGFSEYIVYISFSMTGIPFQRCHSENTARRILGLEYNENAYTRSHFPQEYSGYLCINSIDLSTLKEHATIKEIKFLQGINYATNDKLKDFIIPIYEQRITAQPVQKQAIKIILNSLYGKFAQDLSNTILIYENLDDKHKILAIDNHTFYKPLAGAVTAYARKSLVDMIYFMGKDFIYGDTDSVYFTNRKTNLKRIKDSGLYHESELGKWGTDSKYGGFIKQGKFLSKKNYLLLLADNTKKVVCVGLNRKYHKAVTFDNFNIDSKVFNIEKMVNVYGGKAMRKTIFKIRERVF